MGRQADRSCLVSPEIKHPSTLFDRLQARFRLIGASAVQGGAILRWVNESNLVGWPEYAVAKYPFLFKTDWQEWSIPEFAGSWGSGTPERVWAGELVDIRLQLGSSGTAEATIPQAVEIDWIQLTDVEEQLQGERLPSPGPRARARLRCLSLSSGRSGTGVPCLKPDGSTEGTPTGQRLRPRGHHPLRPLPRPTAALQAFSRRDVIN